MMLLEIVSANYVGAYKVFLNFNNGYQATVDLEKTIINESRSIFQPLQKQEYFKTFAVKLNTICWENEADFAPEFLYELAQHQEQQAMPAVQLQQAA